MFENATHSFSLIRSALFSFRYPNNVISIHADTVILSGLMPCLSDHPQQTTPPTTHPSSFSCFHPALSTTHPFPRDLSHYCHSHCSSLGHSPVCQNRWHRASPPAPCVVTAPCLHRHCGWCQEAPSRRSPSSFSLFLPFSVHCTDYTGYCWSVERLGLLKRGKKILITADQIAAITLNVFQIKCTTLCCMTPYVAYLAHHWDSNQLWFSLRWTCYLLNCMTSLDKTLLMFESWVSVFKNAVWKYKHQSIILIIVACPSMFFYSKHPNHSRVMWERIMYKIHF